MKIIGFCGGSSICELGTTSDVVLFFDCIKYFVSSDGDPRWHVLNDRLYRRYLRLDEMDMALEMMNHVREVFSKTASSEVNWNQELFAGKTWLIPNQKNLADIFVKFFDGFAYCVESAKINYEAFKSYPGYQYEPIRIVPTDLAGFSTEKARPLCEYDTLDGDPFWLR